MVFRNADQADAALLRQPAQYREASVAAYADQRIQPQLPVASMISPDRSILEPSGMG